MTLGSGNERIELHYFGRAHTGGDAWVVFPALRALHTQEFRAPAAGRGRGCARTGPLVADRRKIVLHVAERVPCGFVLEAESSAPQDNCRRPPLFQREADPRKAGSRPSS
jgi:hypothetical protein